MPVACLIGSAVRTQRISLEQLDAIEFEVILNLATRERPLTGRNRPLATLNCL